MKYNRWAILILIIFIYLPVSIDATVLHVAIPTLSLELRASANELLWIIDIYSLIMAGLLLPMGTLGDKWGYKRLAIIGLILFGLASLLAALVTTALMLIFARTLLALGAAMILPATLSAIRHTFTDEKQRSIALGIWSTIGVAGAAIGPLLGGYLLQYFYWGSVFLINVPIVILALIAIIFVVPKQPQNRKQKWQISKALVFIVAILSLIYAVKTGIRGDSSITYTLTITFIGLITLFFFIKQELRSVHPMIDFELFKIKVLKIGIIMAMASMVSIIGFELLLAQELQFVYNFTPLKSGMYMLPLMLASGFGGPLAGFLVPKFGLRIVATAGIGISSLSFIGLALFDFIHHPYATWSMMILLGLSVGCALLASTSAIMSSVPANKSASAGAIEGMAYELGAGFGVVIFGILINVMFSQNLIIPMDLPYEYIPYVSNSINETLLIVEKLDFPASDNLLFATKEAFINAHVYVLLIAATLLAIITFFVWRHLPNKTHPFTHH